MISVKCLSNLLEINALDGLLILFQSIKTDLLTLSPSIDNDLFYWRRLHEQQAGIIEFNFADAIVLCSLQSHVFPPLQACAVLWCPGKVMYWFIFVEIDIYLFSLKVKSFCFHSSVTAWMSISKR